MLVCCYAEPNYPLLFSINIKEIFVPFATYYAETVFWIYSSNPDPDPAKNLNPDPVPDPDPSYFLPLSEIFFITS